MKTLSPTQLLLLLISMSLSASLSSFLVPLSPTTFLLPTATLMKTSRTKLTNLASWHLLVGSPSLVAEAASAASALLPDADIIQLPLNDINNQKWKQKVAKQQRMLVEAAAGDQSSAASLLTAPNAAAADMTPDYSLYHHRSLLLAQVDSLVARHPHLLSMEQMRMVDGDYEATVRVVTVDSQKQQQQQRGQQESAGWRGRLSSRRFLLRGSRGGSMFGDGVVGDSSASWSLPSADAAANEKLRAFLIFGQHGREMITSEVALNLLKAMAGEEHVRSKGWHEANERGGQQESFNNGVGDRETQEEPSGIRVDDDSVEAKKQTKQMLAEAGSGFDAAGSMEDILQQALSGTIFKIVVMENENGRDIVESGNFCERKNGRGVDLNRNWDLEWGVKEKDYDPKEEYPGTSPFSEPEAALIRRIAASFRPHVWLNVHSGMEALFMPYDHLQAVPSDGSAEVMSALLSSLNRRHLQGRCKVGSGGGTVGYVAHGTATDWMFDVLRVPMAFTFEIYGDESAQSSNCFAGFNPNSRDTFNRVLSEWTGTILDLHAQAPQYLKKIPQRLDPQFAFAWSVPAKAHDELKPFNPSSSKFKKGRIFHALSLLNSSFCCLCGAIILAMWFLTCRLKRFRAARLRRQWIGVRYLFRSKSRA